MDDELEQVQSVRKRCFAGLAKLRRLKDVLPSDIKKKVCNATLGLLLSSLARMHKRPENEDREGAELWYAHYTLTATQNAKQEVKRQAEWMTLEKRREMHRLALVRRCVMKEAPHCLNERLAATAEFGSRVTRGHDHNKLFVPQVSTEWYHKSFTFKGSQEWNSLPSEIIGP